MKKLNNLVNDCFKTNFILMSVILSASEILFKILNSFNVFTWSTVRILISTLIISLIITSLTSLIKKRWLKNTINILFVGVFIVYAWFQLGFINFLGVYISLNTSSQFGAVTDYLTDYLASFKAIYYLMFIPLAIYIMVIILLAIKREYKPLIINRKAVLIPITLILLTVVYFGTITLGFIQNKYQTITNRDLFRYADNPSLTINQFGTSVYALLDIKSFLCPQVKAEEIYKANKKEEKTNREVSKDLETIAQNEDNKKYLNLHNYFLSQPVTDYNEYTGMFKDKNVIVVLMESVNDIIINPEYYPNYYKLYSEGWHWENNYSPRNSCATGNNEFSAMTSLYSIYNACTSNVYKDNTYFESIFNVFNNAGYQTNSMHDFSEWYYERPSIHTNMGSNKYYNAKSLGIKTASYYGEWPSDEEFFEKAMDIVLEQDGKWMTWLTTVTSHQPYSSSSTYGDLYKEDFKKEGYSTSLARYMSKLKVVDNAIGIMLERLEEADKLDDTVIVLMADHYPYGLNKNALSEVLEYDLEDYEVERTPFLIYNPSMDAKTFSEYTSYINLVPTLANLLGVSYDPRLYTGTDLLSEDYESRVIFADGSWKNEIAYYNASTGNIKYNGDKTYTEEEIREINSEVNLKISMSNSAIKNDYFTYLKEKIDELRVKEKEEASINEED